MRTNLLLAPEVRDKLERLADRHGSMSLAAEAAIRHAKVAWHCLYFSCEDHPRI